MNLDQLTNAPREIWLGGNDGRTYLVSALELGEWGALQCWLKEVAPDPVAHALDQLARAASQDMAINEAGKRELMRQARADARIWPPKVGTRAWFDLLEETDGGTIRFLWVALRKHQKSFGLDDAAKLEKTMTTEQSTEVICGALGMESPAKKDAKPDPFSLEVTTETATILPLSATTGEKSSTL